MANHDVLNGRACPFASLKDIQLELEELQPPITRRQNDTTSPKSLLNRALVPLIKVVWEQFETELLRKYPDSFGLLKRTEEGELVPYEAEELRALFQSSIEEGPEGMLPGFDKLKQSLTESFRFISSGSHRLMSPRCPNFDNPISQKEYLEVLDLMGLNVRHSSKDCPTSLIYEGLVTSLNATVWMTRQITMSLLYQDVTAFFEEGGAEAFVRRVHGSGNRFLRYLSTMRLNEFTGVGSMWIEGIEDIPIFWIDADASLYTRSDFVDRTLQEMHRAHECNPEEGSIPRDMCPANDAGVLAQLLDWNTAVFENLLLQPLTAIAMQGGKAMDPKRIETPRIV